jgi:endonuclease/exonuclease/phosphatase family metal-dependent hydrolase
LLTPATLPEKVPRFRCLVVLVWATTAAGCVNRQVVLPQESQAATCRALVDESNRFVDAPLVWYETPEGADRREIARACSSVGPAVYVPPPSVESNLPFDDRLVILSWNAHVGAGDIIALVEALRGGRLTGGEPVRDFIVLLQEVFRRGPALPNTAPGMRIPRRIEVSPPTGRRFDVVEVAQALGLGVFYLPSMRNGDELGVEAEDRGNAILSTRPLSQLAGIELPFERQRRVAAVATVMGVDSQGNAWRLRLVSAHLDATASFRRLWVFAAAIRARQAAHLAGVLADDMPTVIGVDLNSWAGGTSESAYRTFRDSYPQTPAPAAEFTFRGGTLDYVFLRLPSQWFSTFGVVDGFFGSDHRPLIGRIDLMPRSASTPSSSSSFQWRRSRA